MSRPHARLALAAGLIAGMLVTPASAQFSPQFNHLKCYKIKDTKVVQGVIADNQFGRERIFKLIPQLLCLPTRKLCCANPTDPSCQPVPCPSDPTQFQPAPVDHFKCYKIVFKDCINAADLTCAKKIKTLRHVRLQDQFGVEPDVIVGGAQYFCAPVQKTVISPSTTTTVTTSTTTTIITTTTTTTSTTTTILYCQQTTDCTGPCPPASPPGAKCTRLTSGKCDCVVPPVCCECPGAACFNTNGQCPTGCNTVPNASCNSATGHCECGLCIDAGTCTNIPCSTGNPCPSNLICDPFHCPRPCDTCGPQGAACNPVPCVRPDGTNAQCRLNGPLPGGTCDCCGPTGSFCTSDFDCCSNICNVTAQTCQ